MADVFPNLKEADHVSVATRRRDGAQVWTPVWFVIVDERLFFRTLQESGKIKRIRRWPEVELAPCTAEGEITGPTGPGFARVLEPDDPLIPAADSELQKRYGAARDEMTRSYGHVGFQYVVIQPGPASA